MAFASPHENWGHAREIQEAAKSFIDLVSCNLGCGK